MTPFYRFVRAVVGLWIRIWYRYRVENLPAECPDGPLILCANHGSLADPLALAVAWPKQVHFLAKKELSNSRFLRWLAKHAGIIFIDRDANDVDSMRKALSVLKDGRTLGIFPEGTRTQSADLRNMKDGLAFLALRGKSAVLSATIEGTFRFRHPITVRFHEVLRYEDYQSLGAVKGRKALTADLFRQIYGVSSEEEGDSHAD